MFLAAAIAGTAEAATGANRRVRLVIISPSVLHWPAVYLRPLWTVLILAAISTAADKKPKPPDLEVLAAAAHRGEKTISLEGHVRNSGDKPLRGLTLIFHFMAPGKKVVTTQKAQIDEELLEPGQQAAFHVELNGPPRSVEFAIDAADGSGRELRVAKSGPFPIE